MSLARTLAAIAVLGLGLGLGPIKEVPTVEVSVLQLELFIDLGGKSRAVKDSIGEGLSR